MENFEGVLFVIKLLIDLASEKKDGLFLNEDFFINIVHHTVLIVLDDKGNFCLFFQRDIFCKFQNYFSFCPKIFFILLQSRSRALPKLGKYLYLIQINMSLSVYLEKFCKRNRLKITIKMF